MRTAKKLNLFLLKHLQPTYFIVSRKVSRLKNINGNVSTLQLLMNLKLLNSEYPPCIISVDNRLAYYKALDYGWLVENEAFAYFYKRF